MSVTMRSESDVGYVELDNPPVNAIDQATRQGLLDAVRWAEKLMLTRVILSGKGRAFAAGADAREFDQPPLEPHLPDVLNAIEQSFVPWIAAINGVALGGGAEVAMACRMRIMAPGAQIGLPEVTLGVVPGAGGTQRLPRLVGLERALEMVTSGKASSAEKALEMGLVHAVEDDPAEAAFMVNTEELGCIVPTWELPAPEPDAQVISTAKSWVSAKMPGQEAPLRAIAVLAGGVERSFHEGLKEERKAFLELRESAQAKALRHIFFAERAAKAPDWLHAEATDLAHVAVVGGGTMGVGIAYALLSAGIRVTLLEADEVAAERARQGVDKLIETAVNRGLLDAPGAETCRADLTVSADYMRAASANLAIEAVFESMEAKAQVFARLEAELSPDAILATNTSYLDIDQIARNLANPSRLVGLHFFAPAHIMRLLEIVRGAKSSPRALATGFALAKKLRKIPVLSGVCDGFIGNRILARYREAADTVFLDGSTPWEVDEAMVAFGYPMGPYEAQDLSGLDIAHANRRRQDATRDPQRRYIPLGDRMVELGKLGKKTGAGWYRYPGGNGKVEDPIVADLALEEAHFAGITRLDYSASEICRRLVLAMINEAADILHEGIAQNARDIDLVTVFGYGFPRWRGGLMHHADTLGAKNIVKELQSLALEDAVAWKVSPLLLHCADTDTPIHDARPGCGQA